VPTFATNAALVIDAGVTTTANALNTGALVVEELVVYVD
jgi:hypothetical protein